MFEKLRSHRIIIIYILFQKNPFLINVNDYSDLL